MQQRLKKRKQNGDFFTIQSFTKKNSNVAAIKHKTQWKNIQNFSLQKQLQPMANVNTYQALQYTYQQHSLL